MNLNRIDPRFLVCHRRGNCIFVQESPLHPPIHTFLPPEYSAAFLRSLNDDDTPTVYILMNVDDSYKSWYAERESNPQNPDSKSGEFAIPLSAHVVLETGLEPVNSGFSN